MVVADWSVWSDWRLEKTFNNISCEDCRDGLRAFLSGKVMLLCKVTVCASNFFPFFTQRLKNVHFFCIYRTELTGASRLTQISMLRPLVIVYTQFIQCEHRKWIDWVGRRTLISSARILISAKKNLPEFIAFSSTERRQARVWVYTTDIKLFS